MRTVPNAPGRLIDPARVSTEGIVLKSVRPSSVSKDGAADRAQGRNRRSGRILEWRHRRPRQGLLRGGGVTETFPMHRERPRSGRTAAAGTIAFPRRATSQLDRAVKRPKRSRPEHEPVAGTSCSNSAQIHGVGATTPYVLDRYRVRRATVFVQVI
jgi:hypothetical protein